MRGLLVFFDGRDDPAGGDSGVELIVELVLRQRDGVVLIDAGARDPDVRFFAESLTRQILRGRFALE